jgi:hypothetical protein
MTKYRNLRGQIRSVAFVLVLFIVPHAMRSQDRPPAVPLVTNDPYFSLWSMADNLTDAPTEHWSQAAQPMIGLIRIDGHVFRWMGTQPRQDFALPAVAAMQQKSVQVMPLHTICSFEQNNVELRVTFFTPLIPEDLDVMSRPVTYLSWSASSTDGRPYQVEVLLDVDPQIAVNDPQQQVTWGRTRADDLTVLNVGTRDQGVLHQSGDRIRIDWGYFHLAVPDAMQASTALSYDSLAMFAAKGMLPQADDMSMPRPADWRSRPAHLAVGLPLGDVASTPVERHVLLGYTEDEAIEYLGRKLRPYWQRNGMTVTAMLDTAESQYSMLESRGQRFDARHANRRW